MISESKRVSETLQPWEVNPTPNTKPPFLNGAESERSFTWGRLGLGLSGGVLVVLLIAAISIPNLLR